MFLAQGANQTGCLMVQQSTMTGTPITSVNHLISIIPLQRSHISLLSRHTLTRMHREIRSVLSLEQAENIKLTTHVFMYAHINLYTHCISLREHNFTFQVSVFALAELVRVNEFDYAVFFLCRSQ